MFRSKVTKIATLALGVLTFSYISNLSITQQAITMKSAQAASDYCGPNNSQAARAAAKFFLFPYNKTFDPACKQHDICYATLRQSGKTKEKCEEEFRKNLYKICEDRSLSQKVSQDLFGYVTNPKLWGGVGMTGPCKRQADYAYWAVSQFGEKALGDQAIHSVKVVSVRANRIYDRWSDDELKVCVKVRNDGNLATEWDLVLLDKKGAIVDTEPDTYERNIKVGQTDEECVTTRGSRYSISDLGSNAQLVVRMDDYPGVAPFAVVAQISVPTTRKRDEFTAVSYSHQSRIEAYKQLLQIKSSSNR
ncbi:hypothetical protein [Nostoc sp. UHCC 0870]|uniref:hypothetical protein n=1 Tax=Nostoc sp. UHCC 0870 TaxID=2914041 RepID=UPI001EDFA764|nr:hypothetical protein [Nostoc sp. UHCC 0870]UKO98572.1 hypothetical protein L6494_02210 [Nostoc sp. UHCC 0870]